MLSMDGRNALAVIEQSYGSLEDFVIFVTHDKPDAMNHKWPISKRAELVGLPVPIFSRIISSPNFKILRRQELVNIRWDDHQQDLHVQKMVGIARGDKRMVMSPNGKVAKVDQAPGDMIASGRYLAELAGMPIEKQNQVVPSVVINIEKVLPPEVSQDDRTLTISTAPEAYRPQTAGGLPPAGVLERTGQAVANPALTGAKSDAGLRSLYDPDVEEALRDRPQAQREGVISHGSAEPEIDDKAPSQRRYGRRWIGRGRSPDPRFMVAGAPVPDGD